MNPCCIEAFVARALEDSFRIADEGERFTCPTCNTVFLKVDGRWKQASLICVRQGDTWTWPDYLGAKTAGSCDQCGAPIYFQAKNADVHPKVCAQCAGLRQE